MKINNFRGDLTDISAKKEALCGMQLAGCIETFQHRNFEHGIESSPMTSQHAS